MSGSIAVAAGPSGYASKHGWIMLNNVWNKDGLSYGENYHISTNYNTANLTDGVDFSWVFPENDKPWPVIRAYPNLMFGSSPWGRGEADPSHVFPIKIDDIKALTTEYNFSVSGDGGGYNVSYDIWFTDRADGGLSSITNELMIWLNKGDISPNGEKISTYTDGLLTGNIYHSGSYTALIMDSETTEGSLDLVKIVRKLSDLGIVAPQEYLTSIQFGAEVVEGAGALTINQLTINVADVRAEEVVATTVTGLGARVAGNVPYAVGTEEIFDSHGVLTGFQSTSIDSSGIVLNQWSDASGKMIRADSLDIDGYGGVLTKHFGDLWQFLGAERLTTSANGTIESQHFSSEWQVTATSTTIGSGSDLLVMKISEDAYDGHAQYTIKVDGVQVGGTFTASASHALGQSDTVTLLGNWDDAIHEVQVNFLNDAWGGTSTADRNLYVDSMTHDGAAVPSSTIVLENSGAAQVSVPNTIITPSTPVAPSTTIGSGSDLLVMKISEDAYDGHAQYMITVDGVQVGGTLTASASHALGQTETVTLLGNWGDAIHEVQVNFLNDAWGGTSATDRNLYVDSMTHDGAAVPSSTMVLKNSGSVQVSVPRTPLGGETISNTISSLATADQLWWDVESASGNVAMMATTFTSGTAHSVSDIHIIG